MKQSCASVEQPCRPVDVDLAQLALAALRGDLRREVHDAVRPLALEQLDEPCRVSEIAGERARLRRLRAVASHERRDVVVASRELSAQRPPDEPARARDQDPH